MEKSAIRLPRTEDETPDWNFMEKFIKELPLSKCLAPVNETELIEETVSSI